MKKIALSAFIAILLCAVPLRARAQDDTAGKIASAAGTEELESDYITREEAAGTEKINIFEKLWRITLDSFSQSGGAAAQFGKIFAALILCCIMRALCAGTGLEKACGFFTVLLLSASAYSAVSGMTAVAAASMKTLGLTLSSYLPVTASLYVMGGNPGAAAANGSAMLLFLNFLQAVVDRALFPLFRASFALSLTGALPGAADTSPLANTLKNAAAVMLSFLFAMLGFALFINTSVAAAGDGLLTRGARFASGVFVPIIGGALGEATRSVAASVGIIKGTVGAAGVVAVGAAALPALIFTAVNRLLFSVAAAAAKVLGCEAEGRFLSSVSSFGGVIFALAAGAMCVGMIAMAVLIRTVGAAA